MDSSWTRRELPRPRRDADGRRRTNVDELRLERPLAVEDLDAIVGAIADIDEPLASTAIVCGTLNWPGPEPREPHDFRYLPLRSNLAMREHCRTVGDVDIAAGIPRHIGRAMKLSPGTPVPCGAGGAVTSAAGGGGAGGGAGGGTESPPACGPSSSGPRPSGSNLITMFEPSSTTQMLSSRSTHGVRERKP